MIAMAMPVRMLTVGVMIRAARAASTWASKFSRTFSSNRPKLTASRRDSWTVRMPLMFSARAPLTIDEASRARLNVSLTLGSHSARSPISAGSTVRVSRPSFRFIASSTAITVTRMTMSAKAPIEPSRNSCSAFTSPCSRAMIRPTWVWSSTLRDMSCRCENIERRRSKITCWASRADSQSCRKLNTRLTTIRAAKPPISQPNGVCDWPAMVFWMTMPIAAGTATLVATKIRIEATAAASVHL